MAKKKQPSNFDPAFHSDQKSDLLPSKENDGTKFKHEKAYGGVPDHGHPRYRIQTFLNHPDNINRTFSGPELSRALGMKWDTMKRDLLLCIQSGEVKRTRVNKKYEYQGGK